MFSTVALAQACLVKSAESIRNYELLFRSLTVDVQISHAYPRTKHRRNVLKTSVAAWSELVLAKHSIRCFAI
jgi:hypothetical protein